MNRMSYKYKSDFTERRIQSVNKSHEPYVCKDVILCHELTVEASVTRMGEWGRNTVIHNIQ